MSSENENQSNPAIISPKHSQWPWWMALFVTIFCVLVFRSLRLHVAETREVRKTTADAIMPTVLVVHPKLSDPKITLRLPGNVKPYVDTPIYARTSGYLKSWMFDLGAHVKEGDLLAEIESPEIDQQYNQAIGSLQQAQARLRLAQITANRWKELLQRNTIARQDADQKEGDFQVAQANLFAAEANVSRLQKLKDFEQILAPFDGIITERNVNIGDLISANNLAANKPLFELVDDKILRVYVNVPETLADQVHLGQKAHLYLASQPGAKIEGELIHSADKIDPGSRTLLVEIQVPNEDRKLMAGGYATVCLPITLAHPVLIIPVNTLLFRPEGTFVGIVNKKGIVELKKIRIGEDFGTTLEVLQGLDPSDQVILNPSDSLQNGESVLIAK